MTQEMVSRPTTPDDLLRSAVEKGVDAGQLEKLTLLYERWEKNRAAERFGDALAKFQADCPPVSKRRAVMNKGGQSERYKFASYEDVMAVAKPHLTANGISVSFSMPKEQDGQLTMVCRVQVGAHAEDRPFSAPKPDLASIAKAMFLTEPQAWGLVLAYFKRYSFCAALGVIVADEDNDAVAANANIGPEEIRQINEKIEECGAIGKPVDMKRFLSWLAVERLGDLTMLGFSKAIGELDRKRRATQKAGQDNGR